MRLHDGTAHTGRIVRLRRRRAPARDGTTLVVELDGGERVHLADVASIAPAPRAAPRATVAIRGSPRARTPSATAATA